MAIWLFTYEPFKGEPTSVQMEKSIAAAGLKGEFVQLRTWLIETAEPVSDLTGLDNSNLMDTVAPLVSAGKGGFVVAPIHSIAGKGWTGDFGAIGRLLASGLPAGPY